MAARPPVPGGAISSRDHFPVNLLGQLLDLFRQLGVLIEQFLEKVDASLGQFLSLESAARDGFTVLRIRLGVSLVAISLAGLSEQDQRSSICGLKADGEVEQDERVESEMGHLGRVEG